MSDNKVDLSRQGTRATLAHRRRATSFLISVFVSIFGRYPTDFLIVLEGLGFNLFRFASLVDFALLVQSLLIVGIAFDPFVL